MTSFWFRLKLFDVRPFAFFSSSTVMPYFLAIEYKLSPDFTVYVFILLSLVGISSCSPTFRFVELRLLYFTRASTVVLYF